VLRRVRTGRPRWHFQMVHHGVWDYDLPAAPNLIDVVVGGRAIGHLLRQHHFGAAKRRAPIRTW